ncbi:heme/hemin ABC transporter substrate-binding protein [Testudinibacter sp. P27/CKL/0425]
MQYKRLIISMGLMCLISSATLAQQIPQKIVSVGSGITEILIALKQRENIVAVDSTSRAAGLNVPILGYQRNLSSEGILALAPTQVIGSEEMGPESVLKQLEAAGIRIDIIKQGNHDVSGLYNQIDQLASLTDNAEAAQQLKNTVNLQVENIKKLTPKPLQGAFVLLSEQRPPQISGDNSTADGVMQLINIQNQVHGKAYFSYSIEQLLALNPKILLVSERSLAQNLPDILTKYPYLSQLQATKNQCVFTLDGRALLGGFNLSSVNEAERIAQAIANNPNCG